MILRSRFPGKRFLPGDIKVAGRRLKSGGEEAAAEFLEGKQRDSVPDFRPPATCVILGQSRPFEQWPIYAASVRLQRYVYSMSQEEFRARTSSIPTSSASWEEWLRPSPAPGFREASSLWFRRVSAADMAGIQVQGMNLMMKNAVNRYKGVLVKAERRWEAARKKAEALSARRKEDGLPPVPVPARESPFGPNGRLVHRPGIDRSIRCFQGVAPRPCPDQDPNVPVQPAVPDRLAIPHGQPGHVPQWQRDRGLVKSGRRRRRMWYSKSNAPSDPSHLRKWLGRGTDDARRDGAVRIEIRIKEDWVVLDARGLLRNVLMREARGVLRAGTVPREGLSLSGLLGLFSGDPVIDPVRGTVTFLYKEDVVQVASARPVGVKKSRAALQKMASRGPFALLSCDLGETHYVAARASLVSADEDGLKVGLSVTVDPDQERPPFRRPSASRDCADCGPTMGDRDGGDHVGASEALRRVRTASDALERSLRAVAVSSLTEAQRAEVLELDRAGARDSRASLCRKLGLDEAGIRWDQMGPRTTFIAEALLAAGRDDEAVLPGGEDGALRTDSGFARDVRPRLSGATRRELNEALWEAKRASPEYGVISARKSQAARRLANYVVREAGLRLGVKEVAVNVEDLNISSGFFSGRGRREPGWDGFFRPRMENRWFIAAIHKAFCDLAAHRGVLVIESPPQRTSITCPDCGHCDRESRSGTVFLCVSCGARMHSDFDVATRNLERVALTSKPMPKPAVPSESLDTAPAAATARRASRGRGRPAGQDRKVA